MVNQPPVRSFLMVFALLASSSSASAQWHVAAFLGDASTSPARLTIRSEGGETAVTVESVHLGDESFDSPWYYGARITRQLERMPCLGFEVEFIHAKAIADTSQPALARGLFDGAAVDRTVPLDAILPRFELSHGLNFVLGNAVVFWPVHQSGPPARFTLTGRFGAGPTVPHVEATFASQTEDAYQLGSPAIAVAVGGQVRLTAHLATIAEFKLTRTHEHLHVGFVEIDGAFTSRHLVAGLAWQTTSH